MAKFIKNNIIFFFASMLVGLLCWLSEKAIEANVRLSVLEQRIDKITNEILIIKDNYQLRRKQ